MLKRRKIYYMHRRHYEVKDHIKITKKTADAWRNQLPIDFRVGLNPGLIFQQELDRPDVGLVFAMHGEKLMLFHEMQDFLLGLTYTGEITPEDQEKILGYNKILKGLEFSAQRAWKFPENEDFHNWWLDVPGCTCPQMDNMERVGIPGNINSGDCVWHGLFDTTKTEI